MRDAKTKRALSRVLLLCAAAGASSAAHAQSVVPQAGANPFPINQTATTDNLIVLTAGSAERLDSAYVENFGNPKYNWIVHFDRADEYLRWTVSLRSAATYQVTMPVAAGAAGTTFDLFVDGVQASSGTSTRPEWDRISLGTISLPAGQHTITLKRAAAGASATIKSLELLRESDAAAYASRVAAFRADTATFSNYDYGLMLQYGPWGYPRSGPKKSIDQQAADFDVPAFVAMVKSTGAKYVLWSITWWTYQISAPIAEVDAIVGNGDRTSQRDLIGDVAAALKKEGIGFYLYYHTGQDSHLGYDSTDWWQKQAWPDSFTLSGTGDRSVFFRNWTSVIAAIGNRYGSNLDGWFFDDGVVYYPAAFEALGAAARAGNAKRLISYNSWYAPSYTDFQDVSFGEICKPNAAPIGGDGRYQFGPEKGLASHCMETMETDWGIHYANQGIASPEFTAQTFFGTVALRARQKLPTSINLLMWEDGTVSPASLAVLQGAKRLFDDAAGCTFGCARYNNDNAVISYAGTWGRSTDRNAGDFGNDVSYTTANGDSATISFTGGAVRLFAPKDASYGDFEVVLDGVSQGTFSAYTSQPYTPRQLVYAKAGLSYGDHTLKIIKRSGNYMQIDHVDVDQSITRINDTSSAITKSGSWNLSANRTADDYQNDVSYTTTNGNSFSYTFNGTGVQILMPRDGGQGNVEFFLDGVSQGQTSTRATLDYHPQEVMFSIKDLAPGQHTVSARKVSGSYMQLDAIEITGN